MRPSQNNSPTENGHEKREEAPVDAAEARQEATTEIGLDKADNSPLRGDRKQDQTARRDDKKADTKPEEIGGPKGPEPTRYGDWERNGRCYDF